ncbi:NrsF family protein, partial [Rhizobium ruizarguesonis]
RPDGSEGRFFGTAAAIILALAVMAVIQLALSPAASYPVLVLGSSALHCPLLIFAFAMPIMIANTWVLRGGAPSKLGITGFIAGIAAGAFCAWVYSWFCTENGMPFVTLWYSLGILLTGAIGALLG